ncbi:MAG TPA: maleylpyruvate isomerase family mycothiol-dependent enzyme [Acidimicrobiales bacterium]|nr:maleylpyruvate isomerase family mycothiol-dependent enzyme [Acidimicrobiales bacterium]
MGLSQIRQVERDALCSTLHEVGADAPTLCSAWSAIDVAAHLVVSEAYGGWPMVAAYRLRRFLPPAVTRTGMRSLQSVGDRQMRRARARGWDWLLGRLAGGPPAAYERQGVASVRWIEEWIHHEDVRRANGVGVRVGSAEIDEALWDAGLVLTGFPEFLPGREGLELATTAGRAHRLGATSKVRIEGRPGEILLFLAGRASAAEVEVTGDQAYLARLDLAV